MKVLYFTLECKPFSKVGGVGDVALELPLALKDKGVDIEIITPLYGSVDKSWIEGEAYREYTVPFKDRSGKEIDEVVKLYNIEYRGISITFISNSTYFEGKYEMPYVFSDHTPYFDDFIRFNFFSLAAAELINDKSPDIIHANDWGLGFLLGKLKHEKSTIPRVLTIHNNSYQGNMWIPAIRNWSIADFLSDRCVKKDFIDPRKRWNSINPLRLGILSSDYVNTVSPTYKREMLKRDNRGRFFSGGNGLERDLKKMDKLGRFKGILNGFEYKHIRSYNETLDLKNSSKRELSSHFYSPENFLIGFVGRAVEQKFKLLQEEYDGKSVLEHITDNKNVNIAILATGLPEYEEFLLKFKDYTNVSVTLAFDRELAAKISLGCDLFLMPSLYEPCGITQMESLSNATPPLVRFVGGLKDTVTSYKKSRGTGFGFNGLTRKSVLKNLVNEVFNAMNIYYNDQESYDNIRREAFKQRFLWKDSAEQYFEIYKELNQG